MSSRSESRPLSTSSVDEQPERTDVVEQLHGVRVADPYRYLEDPDDPRTQAFVAAQNELSGPALASLPAREFFAETVLGLITTPRYGAPWERGGRYFRMQNPGDLDQDLLVCAEDLETLLSAPTVLLDPNTLADDATIALNVVSTSPDGSVLAVGLSEAGSDWQSIKFVRATPDAAGAWLADELAWSKFSRPTWTPDGSGVLYWRYPPPSGQAYVQEMPPGELVLHRLGTPQDDDEQVWARQDEQSHTAQWMVDPEFSSDDRWLILTASPGTDSRTVVEVRQVQSDGSFGPAQAVISELTAAWHPIDVVDGALHLLTDDGAPRRKIVRIALQPTVSAESSTAAEVQEVLPEYADAVIDAVVPVGGSWAVITSIDTAHRLEIMTTGGVWISTVEIEHPAAVLALHGRWASAEFFVSTTSFTVRQTVRRVELSTPVGDVRVLAEPAGGRTGPVQPPMRTERRAGVSADGTSVPMTVIQRSDLIGSAPRPALLYGYGGFDIALTPSYSALITAWVAAGGVAAIANLRGGGEFGQDWHRAGMLHDKQRVFDDLYGCAEALIADGTTTSGQLAVHGRSNGGLLVGAALTQRPELWSAALPTVGVLDMLRFHRFTIGAAWTTEYGNPDDAADFPVLLAYSPLHNITEGREYPATLICTGDHDDRVVPAHSFKFAAELERAQGGPAPILLRIDTRAGHGAGKPVTALAAEYADQLAFAAAHTGLVPPGSGS